MAERTSLVEARYPNEDDDLGYDAEKLCEACEARENVRTYLCAEGEVVDLCDGCYAAIPKAETSV